MSNNSRNSYRPTKLAVFFFACMVSTSIQFIAFQLQTFLISHLRRITCAFEINPIEDEEEEEECKKPHAQFPTRLNWLLFVHANIKENTREWFLVRIRLWLIDNNMLRMGYSSFLWLTLFLFKPVGWVFASNSYKFNVIWNENGKKKNKKRKMWTIPIDPLYGGYRFIFRFGSVGIRNLTTDGYG